MSDKEKHLPGRRHPKVISRPKKKEPKADTPVDPEAKKTDSEAVEQAKAPSSSESESAIPERVPEVSEPKAAPADAYLHADKGKDRNSAASEEAAFARADSEGESSVPEKSSLEAGSNAEAALRSSVEKGKGDKAPKAPLAGSAAGVSEESASSVGNGYGKLRLWFRVLVIGLLIAAVGNAYYARTLADREREARQALAEKLTEQLATQVEKHVDSQLEERLAGREESFREATAHLVKENKKHAEELQEIQEKIAALESTLGVLRTEAQKSPEAEDWDIAEVAYLLRIANERLQLERDVKTTLVALRAADQILRKVADPALTPVRSRLAEEINALKALPAPDISGMALSLASLIEQVRDLEFKESVIEEATTVAEAEVSATGEVPEEDSAAAKAQRLLRLIWEDLRHLVTVRRRGKGEDGLPVLPPEERYFLYRNLELELEAARLSLLRKDDEGFHQSLQLAQNWLQSYFQGSEAEVMQETLAELAQTSIQPSLPDISGSLKTLNRVWGRARSQTTGGN